MTTFFELDVTFKHYAMLKSVNTQKIKDFETLVAKIVKKIRIFMAILFLLCFIFVILMPWWWAIESFKEPKNGKDEDSGINYVFFVMMISLLSGISLTRTCYKIYKTFRK